QLVLDLLAQRAVEIEHVLPRHPAQLEMRDGVLPADLDLFVKLRRNLICKRGQLQHNRSCLRSSLVYVGATLASPAFAIGRRKRRPYGIHRSGLHSKMREMPV